MRACEIAKPTREGSYTRRVIHRWPALDAVAPAHPVLGLQQKIGNQTVSRLIARKRNAGQLADGLVRDFWAFGEQYDGKYFAADLDLTPLAGQNVRFVFTILSIGDAANDRALWVQPRVVR